jgi:hypothetical protein
VIKQCLKLKYIMLGKKIKYRLWFRKMTSLQHYKQSTIKLVLHVCISIFPNNWKFMKLCEIPLSNISFCNSYNFQCFHFCNIYTYTIMNMCDLKMMFMKLEILKFWHENQNIVIKHNFNKIGALVTYCYCNLMFYQISPNIGCIPFMYFGL